MKDQVVRTLIPLSVLISLSSLLICMQYSSQVTQCQVPTKSLRYEDHQSVPLSINLDNGPQPWTIKQTNILRNVKNRTKKKFPGRNLDNGLQPWTIKQTNIVRNVINRTTKKIPARNLDNGPGPGTIKQTNIVRNVKNVTTKKPPARNLNNGPQSGTNKQTNIVRNIKSKTTKKPPARNGTKHMGWPPTEEQRLKRYRGSPCHKLHFAHPPLPVIALASFPGSGNHWLRHLIQEATGLVTGAVYWEQDQLTDFPGGGITDGRVVVVKTHLVDFGIENLSGAIILVRNPFNALISYFNYLQDTNRINGSGAKAWQNHVVDEINTWSQDYNKWLQLPKPKLVVVYEDLKRNTRSEMKRIIKFLNLTVTDEKLECMMRNSEGNYHRKPYDTTLYPFPQKVTKIIKGRVSYINKLLLHYNIHRTIGDKLPTKRMGMFINWPGMRGTNRH